jgi:saccharopine dehydrogenase (NAD+, L-lysine-forming)
MVSETPADRPKLWLRHETKAYEERVTVTPEAAKQLMEKWAVHVERSPTRIIKDAEYEKAGCTMEDTGSWVNLPQDDSLLVVGLKELALDTFPIVNKHTYFAHVFKGQEGWQDVLTRYKKGGGVIYDYEFLANPQGYNVGAGMSPFAGFVGCAVSLRAWCHQELHPGTPLPPVKVSTKQELVDELRVLVEDVKGKGKAAPVVLVMGALGRCGGGAVDCASRVGLDVIKWDKDETAKGGPFPEILTDCDVFINCILLQGSMAPFITHEVVDKVGPQRRLRVIGDVSCDPNSTNNPIPLYDAITSWEEPSVRVRDDPPLDIVSIDNLPSVLALEASHAFAELLLPALMAYPQDKGWAEAKKVFDEKMALVEEPALAAAK